MGSSRGQLGRSKDDRFGLGRSWNPSRIDLELITEYLVGQPEQGEMEWDTFCEALASGILVALNSAGRDPGPIRGKAHWFWAEEINVHIPCCSVVGPDGTWCGNGPLPDHLIPEGDCGEHE